MIIPLVEFRFLLRNSCTKETSDAPDKWTPENPLFGHCAVIASIVQDFFGGKIRRALFPKEWADRLGSRSHYWNILPDGTVVDLSREQFPKDFPYREFIEGKVGEMSVDKDWREYILSYEATLKRYSYLSGRVNGLLESRKFK